MAREKDDSVILEVDERLEDLFGEDDRSPDAGEKEDSFEVSPLWDLKAIILSIDWEITDEIMTKLTEQIGRSRDAYKNDKAIVLFLQLLDSVGKYIKVNKANTHPDAIKLLNSVYTSLEKVALSKGISSAEKEKTLLFEVKRFKKLKEKIALRKAEVGRKKEAPPPAPPVEGEGRESMPDGVDTERLRPHVEEVIPDIRQERIEATPLSSDDLERHSLLDDTKDELPASEMSGMTPHEAFSYALMEIKRLIKAEFEALRAELKLWRQGQ